MASDIPEKDKTTSHQHNKGTLPSPFDPDSEYRLFQTVFEEQDIPAVIIDPHNIIIKANEAFRRMVGDIVPEVLGQNINHLVVPPDRREEGEQASTQVLAGKRLHGYITKRLIKGTISDVRINAYPVQNDRGIYIAATYEDITHELFQKKVQEALYAISALAHENLSPAELYAKIHGIILELFPAKANNFYIALLNDNKTGISFPYYADQKDEPPVGEIPFGNGLTEYVLRTGLPLHASAAILQELEAKKEIVRVGSPSDSWLGIPLQSGTETIGVMVIQSYTPEISYSKAEEQVFQFIADCIADVIIKRAQQEEVKRLQEEQKEQEIMASIGRVAAGMAHMINNKLQAAQLHLEFAKQKQTSSAEHLSLIQQSINAIANMIRQLRLFAHKAILSPHKISLSSILHHLQNKYPLLIIEDLPEDYILLADPTAIQDMLNALVENAMMACQDQEDDKEKKITLTAEQISSLPSSIPTTTKNKMVQAPSWIHIVVSDTGVGIDPTSMETLFVPFAPIKPYAPIDGAVLGLASAQEIAKQHGGTIEAESILGRGTKMHVYLPLGEKKREEEHQGNQQHDIPHGNGECILVVEDETSLL